MLGECLALPTAANCLKEEVVRSSRSSLAPSSRHEKIDWEADDLRCCRRMRVAMPIIIGRPRRCRLADEISFATGVSATRALRFLPSASTATHGAQAARKRTYVDRQHLSSAVSPPLREIRLVSSSYALAYAPSGTRLGHGSDGVFLSAARLRCDFADRGRELRR